MVWCFHKVFDVPTNENSNYSPIEYIYLYNSYILIILIIIYIYIIIYIWVVCLKLGDTLFLTKMGMLKLQLGPQCVAMKWP